MLTGPGTSIVKAMGKPHFEFHYSLANIVAIGVLLPALRFITGGWSVTSIAVTVSLATLLSAAWFLWVANRELKLSGSCFAREVQLPAVVPYVAATLVGWPMLSWFTPHTRLESATVLVLGGLSYGVACAGMLFAWVATEKERAILVAAINRRLKRNITLPAEALSISS